MYRKTWMEVNLDAIYDNVRTIKEHCGKKFIAVLKADAYGCGDYPVAKTCLEAGADMIAVSSLDEALILRNKGYEGDLFILGPVDPKDIPIASAYNIAVAAISAAWVNQVCRLHCKGLKVHLAYDTGMNRIGFKDLATLHEAYDLLLQSGCSIEGIFTHFCNTDKEDRSYTDNQFAEFKKAVASLNHPFQWIHCDNSDATIFFEDEISNACRVGISLYGISPYTDCLKPAISLYSEISMSKSIQAGQSIGYGWTYTAKQDEIIGTCPIGYADGFVRRNQGRNVYVDGMMCEVVGRICMDQCMIRLNHDVKPGTPVEIFGPHIPLESMAKDLNTIPYEIICLISGRVTRRYLYHGKPVNEITPRLNESL